MWSWLRDAANARAVGVLLIGVPALFAGITFVYSILWPTPNEIFEIPATKFALAEHVNVGRGECQSQLVLNEPPWSGVGNAVEYRITARTSEVYALQIEYAAQKEEGKPPRMVDIDVNDEKQFFTGRLSVPTGSWCQDQTRWENVGNIKLKRGDNTVRIHTEGNIPHLKTIKLVRVSS